MKVNNPVNIAKQKLALEQLSNRIALGTYIKEELYKIAGIPSKYLGNESK